MLPYTWEDGCGYCKHRIYITNKVYVCERPTGAPHWFSCRLNKNIMTPQSPIPPEKCPLRSKQ